MQKTIEFLQNKLKEQNFDPKIGMILGSGLGSLADEVEGISIKYEDIPDFSRSSVEGHAGELVVGRLCNKDVLIMKGRFHFYEGYSMDTVVYPVRVMKKLGVEKLIVTNAAGGVNTDFTPGDLMIIEDHLNLQGTNPLIGHNNPEFGPRFPDMSEPYNKEMIKIIENIAKELNIKHQKGVYAGLTGPTYETPAEVKMIRALGADAVGMSTVPEVIVANHMGIKTVGVSCITNMAAGILPQPLNHQEVIETAAMVRDNFLNLIKTFLVKL